MSTLLASLADKLTAIEQEIQALPRELDSIVGRLDRGRLRGLLSRLDEDFNKLFDARDAGYARGMLVPPFIIETTYPWGIREVTDEDLRRWREAYKSRVRVVIGRGRVAVMTAAAVAEQYKTAVSQIPVAQQQGCMILSWDQYQKLAGEIERLLGEDREAGKVNGLSPSTSTPE